MSQIALQLRRAVGWHSLLRCLALACAVSAWPRTGAGASTLPYGVGMSVNMTLSGFQPNTFSSAPFCAWSGAVRVASRPILLCAPHGSNNASAVQVYAWDPASVRFRQPWGSMQARAPGSACTSPRTAPAPRSDGAVVAVGLDVFLLGGRGPFRTPLGDCWKFSTVTGAWRQCAAMPPDVLPRWGAAPAVVGTDILLFGGFTSQQYAVTATTLVYQSAADRWFSLYLPSQTAPPARAFACAAAGNDANGNSVLWLAGGTGGFAAPLADIWVLHLSLLQWQRGAQPLQFPTFGALCSVHGSHLVLAWGLGSAGLVDAPLGVVQGVDMSSGTPKTLSTPGGVANAASPQIWRGAIAAMGDVMLVFGGAPTRYACQNAQSLLLWPDWVGGVYTISFTRQAPVLEGGAGEAPHLRWPQHTFLPGSMAWPEPAFGGVGLSLGPDVWYVQTAASRTADDSGVQVWVYSAQIKGWVRVSPDCSAVAHCPSLTCASPSTRTLPSVIAVGSYIFMHGGVQQQSTDALGAVLLRDTWLFDTLLGTWRCVAGCAAPQPPDLPPPRYLPQLMVVNGTDGQPAVLLLGGFPQYAADPSTLHMQLAPLTAFNTSTGAWEELPEPAAPSSFILVQGLGVATDIAPPFQTTAIISGPFAFTGPRMWRLQWHPASQTLTWDAIPPSPQNSAPTGLQLFSVASANGFFFVAGGIADYGCAQDGGVAICGLWAFDLSQGAWLTNITQVADGQRLVPLVAPVHRTGSDTRLVVFGGEQLCGASYVQNSIWQLALATLHWEQNIEGMPDTPRARAFASTAQVQHQALLFGGLSNAGTTLSDLWSFNTAAGSYTPLHWGGSTAPPGRGLAATAWTGDALLLFGGMVPPSRPGQAPTWLKDTWAFSTANGTWRELPHALPPTASFDARPLMLSTTIGTVLVTGAQLWMWDAGASAWTAAPATVPRIRFLMSSPTEVAVNGTTLAPPVLLALGCPQNSSCSTTDELEEEVLFLSEAPFSHWHTVQASVPWSDDVHYVPVGDAAFVDGAVWLLAITRAEAGASRVHSLLTLTPSRTSASHTEWMWGVLSTGVENLPQAQEGAAVAAVGPALWLFGGQRAAMCPEAQGVQGQYRLHTTWYFDTSSTVWGQQPSTPTGTYSLRSGNGAGFNSVDGALWLWGGAGFSGQDLINPWTFNASSAVWREVAASGSPGRPTRSHVATSATVGTSIWYALCNDSSAVSLAPLQLWQLDTQQQSWLDATPSLQALQLSCAAATTSIVNAGQRLWISVYANGTNHVIQFNPFTSGVLTVFKADVAPSGPTGTFQPLPPGMLSSDLVSVEGTLVLVGLWNSSAGFVFNTYTLDSASPDQGWQLLPQRTPPLLQAPAAGDLAPTMVKVNDIVSLFVGVELPHVGNGTGTDGADTAVFVLANGQWRPGILAGPSAFGRSGLSASQSGGVIWLYGAGLYKVTDFDFKDDPSGQAPDSVPFVTVQGPLRDSTTSRLASVGTYHTAGAWHASPAAGHLPPAASLRAVANTLPLRQPVCRYWLPSVPTAYQQDMIACAQYETSATSLFPGWFMQPWNGSWVDVRLLGVVDSPAGSIALHTPRDSDISVQLPRRAVALPLPQQGDLGMLRGYTVMSSAPTLLDRAVMVFTGPVAAPGWQNRVLVLGGCFDGASCLQPTAQQALLVDLNDTTDTLTDVTSLICQPTSAPWLCGRANSAVVCDGSSGTVWSYGGVGVLAEGSEANAPLYFLVSLNLTSLTWRVWNHVSTAGGPFALSPQLLRPTLTVQDSTTLWLSGASRQAPQDIGGRLGALWAFDLTQVQCSGTDPLHQCWGKWESQAWSESLVSGTLLGVGGTAPAPTQSGMVLGPSDDACTAAWCFPALLVQSRSFRLQSSAFTSGLVTSQGFDGRGTAVKFKRVEHPDAINTTHSTFLLACALHSGYCFTELVHLSMDAAWPGDVVSLGTIALVCSLASNEGSTVLKDAACAGDAGAFETLLQQGLEAAAGGLQGQAQEPIVVLRPGLVLTGASTLFPSLSTPSIVCTMVAAEVCVLFPGAAGWVPSLAATLSDVQLEDMRAPPQAVSIGNTTTLPLITAASTAWLTLDGVVVRGAGQREGTSIAGPCIGAHGGAFISLSNVTLLLCGFAGRGGGLFAAGANSRSAAAISGGQLEAAAPRHSSGASIGVAPIWMCFKGWDVLAQSRFGIGPATSVGLAAGCDLLLQYSANSGSSPGEVRFAYSTLALAGPVMVQQATSCRGAAVFLDDNARLVQVPSDTGMQPTVWVEHTSVGSKVLDAAAEAVLAGELDSAVVGLPSTCGLGGGLYLHHRACLLWGPASLDFVAEQAQVPSPLGAPVTLNSSSCMCSLTEPPPAPALSVGNTSAAVAGGVAFCEDPAACTQLESQLVVQTDAASPATASVYGSNVAGPLQGLAVTLAQQNFSGNLTAVAGMSLTPAATLRVVDAGGSWAGGSAAADWVVAISNQASTDPDARFCSVLPGLLRVQLSAAVNDTGVLHVPAHQHSGLWAPPSQGKAQVPLAVNVTGVPGSTCTFKLTLQGPNSPSSETSLSVKMLTCSAGTAFSGTGESAHSCLPCPPGTWAPGGDVPCTACPKALRCPGGFDGGWRASAQQGFYKTNGTIVGCWQPDTAPASLLPDCGAVRGQNSSLRLFDPEPAKCVAGLCQGGMVQRSGDALVWRQYCTPGHDPASPLCSECEPDARFVLFTTACTSKRSCMPAWAAGLAIMGLGLLYTLHLFGYLCNCAAACVNACAHTCCDGLSCQCPACCCSARQLTHGAGALHTTLERGPRGRHRRPFEIDRSRVVGYEPVLPWDSRMPGHKLPPAHAQLLATLAEVGEDVQGGEAAQTPLDVQNSPLEEGGTEHPTPSPTSRPRVERSAAPESVTLPLRHADVAGVSVVLLIMTSFVLLVDPILDATVGSNYLSQAVRLAASTAKQFSTGGLGIAGRQWGPGGLDSGDCAAPGFARAPVQSESVSLLVPCLSEGVRAVHALGLPFVIPVVGYCMWALFGLVVSIATPSQQPPSPHPRSAAREPHDDLTKPLLPSQGTRQPACLPCAAVGAQCRLAWRGSCANMDWTWLRAPTAAEFLRAAVFFGMFVYTSLTTTLLDNVQLTSNPAGTGPAVLQFAPDVEATPLRLGLGWVGFLALAALPLAVLARMMCGYTPRRLAVHVDADMVPVDVGEAEEIMAAPSPCATWCPQLVCLRLCSLDGIFSVLSLGLRSHMYWWTAAVLLLRNVVAAVDTAVQEPLPKSATLTALYFTVLSAAIQFKPWYSRWANVLEIGMQLVLSAASVSSLVVVAVTALDLNAKCAAVSSDDSTKLAIDDAARASAELFSTITMVILVGGSLVVFAMARVLYEQRARRVARAIRDLAKLNRTQRKDALQSLYAHTAPLTRSESDLLLPRDLSSPSIQQPRR